jgi:hypothetical protein
MYYSVFRPFARSGFPLVVRFPFIWAGPAYGTPTVPRVFVDFLSVPTANFWDINHNFGATTPPPLFLQFIIYTIPYNVVTLATNK